MGQCVTQTQAGTLEPCDTLRSPVLLVRYLVPRFIMSVHESGGNVLIWDALQLELRQVLQTPDCLCASCAVWNSKQHLLFVFGARGVSGHVIRSTFAMHAFARML